MSESIDDLLTDNVNEAAAPAQETSQGSSEPVEVKKPRRRRSATQRPAEALYSMAQVAQIIDFVTEFDDAPASHRQAFFGIFGWPLETDADGMRVAQTIKDTPADVQAFNLLKDMIDLLTRGGIGFKETIALVGRFSALEPAVLTAFATAVSGVTPAQSPVEYGRRTEVADLLSETVDHLTTLMSDPVESERTIKALAWIDDLVTTWPGK